MLKRSEPHTNAILQKHAQDPLRAGDAYARALFDNSFDAILIVRTDGSIQSANQAACSLFGSTLAELCGTSIQGILYTSDAQFATAIQVLSQTRKFRGEFVLTRKDGTRFPARVTSAVFKDHAGYELTSIIIREITGRTEIEAQFKSERMAALGRMAAALAHEINNPLQAITSALDLVLDFNLEPGEREDNLRIIRQEIERLNEITSRILNFARPQPVPRRLLFVDDLLQDTLKLARKQLQRAQVHLTTDFQAVPQVMAAPEQLKQVFLNLILNSVEAVQTRGRLHIATGVRSGIVTIAFMNEGPNIPVQDLSHIFEPFFTTKSNGNGIGLSISLNLVQQHGGTITVENVPRGVIFTVHLPAGAGEKEGDFLPSSRVTHL